MLVWTGRVGLRSVQMITLRDGWFSSFDCGGNVWFSAMTDKAVLHTHNAMLYSCESPWQLLSARNGRSFKKCKRVVPPWTPGQSRSCKKIHSYMCRPFLEGIVLWPSIVLLEVTMSAKTVYCTLIVKLLCKASRAGLVGLRSWTGKWGTSNVKSIKGGFGWIRGLDR